MESHKIGDFTYNIESVIGYGSFGQVYKAVIQETDEIVAVKKVFQDNRYKSRELQLMKEINHPNIVNLKNFFYTNGDNQEEVYLNVVMNFMPNNIYAHSRRIFKQQQQMPLMLVKVYSYQFFRAIAYLHHLNICHRDIKPQNLLVDPETHIIRLCDLGSAKKLNLGEINVSYICSRYYRAPELIFGSIDYTTAVDIWSAGCVLAELLIGRVVFAGESGTDQLIEVIKYLGTPTRDQLRIMNSHFQEYKFPYIRAQSLKKLFPAGSPKDGIDLVLQILRYNPQQRPTCMEILAHPFYDDLRQQDVLLPDGVSIPDLFNWNGVELENTPRELIDRITPSWAKTS